MKTRVADVMTKAVRSARPGTTFREVARTLTSLHISALPVVDVEGIVVGGMRHLPRARLSRVMALKEPVSDPARTSVFESLPDGIVLVDLEGTITYVNRQLATWAGYSPEELVGRKIEDLVPEALRGQHRSHRASYVSHGLLTRPMGTSLRTRLRTRQHHELPVDIALRQVETERGKEVLASVRDATDRIRAQERIESLLEVSQHILANEPAEEVLALIARHARHLVEADVALVSVPSADRTEMIVEVADGDAEDELRGSRLPVEGSLSGQVYRTGHSLVIRDAHDVRFKHYLLGSLGFGPSIVVALGAPGSIFGAISVGRQADRAPFSDPEVKVVELFASQAAVALDYSRVRDELGRLAVLEDRERIGRELHDGVIQSLFAVGMNLQASALMVGPGKVQDRLEKDVGELDRAIRDLRNYIFGLRPGILADHQLGQAIAQLASETEEESDISVAVDVDPQLAAELTFISGDIVQLVREALSNLARHSGAATGRVSLRREDGAARLVVEDDGKGFDPSEPSSGQGMGNLRNRVSRLGGELLLTSRPGEGTRLEMTFPL